MTSVTLADLSRLDVEPFRPAQSRMEMSKQGPLDNTRDTVYEG